MKRTREYEKDFSGMQARCMFVFKAEHIDKYVLM